MSSKPPATGNALKAGDRRAALEEMRDVLADAFLAAGPNVVAQIAGRLQAVLLEIDQLPSLKKVSKADELAGRRAARRAASKVPASARGEGGVERT